MKISVFKDDAGYENYLAYRPLVIYVNGEVLNNVVRLDTDEGWAEFNVKGADGLFLIEEGHIVTGIAEGVVEIEGEGITRIPVIEPEVPLEPDQISEDDEDA